MKNIFQFLVIFFLISSCSWIGIKDRSNDYLSAQETQVTVLPEHLDASRLGQLYPVPQTPSVTLIQDTAGVPRPQPISVNTFERLVKIQRIDKKRWVLINNTPSELWPRVRNVLNRNGFPTASVNGSAGIIETTWLTYNSDEESEHRFRLALSPGVQLNSTEIKALHQSRTRGQEIVADWPIQSDIDAKEQDMVSFIANELATQKDSSSVSLLAQEIGGESKVEIINPEISDPFILVKLSYDRSWASVLYSLSRGGFSLIDQDQTQGLFLVNFTDEIEDVKSSGFLGWFGKNSTKDILEANFRILFQQVESNIEVRVITYDGNSLDNKQALKLLNIIRSNMS